MRIKTIKIIAPFIIFLILLTSLPVVSFAEGSPNETDVSSEEVTGSTQIVQTNRKAVTEKKSGDNNRTLNSILFFLFYAACTALIVFLAFKVAKIKKEKEKNGKQ